MEIIKVRPRGYCYGVVDAMQIAKTVAKKVLEEGGGPVYILGLLIHNRHALEELDQLTYRTIAQGGCDSRRLFSEQQGQTRRAGSWTSYPPRCRRIARARRDESAID